MAHFYCIIFCWAFMIFCAYFHWYLSFLLSVINIFADLLYVLSISRKLWVKNNLFLFSCLLWFFLELNFCHMLIVLWFSGWHQFFIVNVSSLFRVILSKSSAYCGSVNYKVFFCSDLNCYSNLFSPVINWFFSLKKYNNKNKTQIQHVYTTEWYNTFNTL